MTKSLKQLIMKAVADGLRQHRQKYPDMSEPGYLVTTITGSVCGMLYDQKLELVDAIIRAKIERLEADLLRTSQKLNKTVDAHKKLAVELGRADPSILD